MEPLEKEFNNLSDDGGLRKRIIRPGDGDLVSPMSLVQVHYTGRLHPEGKKFDSSLDRNQPLEFKVGEGRVIKGWDQTLLTMRVGEICEIICEPDYAYGVDGNPPTIPKNATLLFEMELVSSKPPEDPLSKKLADAASSKAAGNSSFAAADFASAAKSYRFGVSRLEYTWGATPAELAEISALKVSLNANLAASLLKTKDLNDAIDACDRVLEIDAVNVKALFRKGQAYAGLSAFEKAEETFKAALEVNNVFRFKANMVKVAQLEVGF
ncbi:cytochrome P450 monooxygenase 9 [Physocladia obscura]|uniref:peptidylprolyl isomerase n=1 Tax=Physocladia obscura TaxID=109957 RepID=A0AAD5SVK2_9FUNG|nr:cytochrome P450 monooxygenase 9 [Physocladia obscura]